MTRGTNIAIGGIIILFVIVLVSVTVFPAAWEEGAPTSTIKMTIRNVETNDEFITTFDVGPDMISTATFLPAQSFTAEVPAVDPNGVYTLTFDITYSVDFDADMDIIARGRKNNHAGTTLDYIFINQAYNWKDNDPTSEFYQFFDTATISGPNSFIIFLDEIADLPDPTTNIDVLLGEFIDQSLFHFTFDAEGFDPVTGGFASGRTAFDVTVNVGAKGTITVTIDNIQTDAVLGP